MMCSILGQAAPQQLAAASLADGPMTWMQVWRWSSQRSSLCFRRVSFVRWHLQTPGPEGGRPCRRRVVE